MAIPADDTVYCLRHGWVQIVDGAMLKAGTQVTICPLCNGVA